jgi:hypothetical protein
MYFKYTLGHRKLNQTCFELIERVSNRLSIDWVSAVFINVENEMCGLEWGRLYEEYHKKAYDPKNVSAEVRKLYGDPYVKNRRGVFEDRLGGLVDRKLLEIRVFLPRQVFPKAYQGTSLAALGSFFDPAPLP